MNFLQLAQKIHLILRIGEETPGTQPTTVVAQEGVLSEMVTWVNAAHEDICHAREWNFLRAGLSLSLAQGGRVLSKSAIQTQVPTFDELLPFVSSDGAFIGLTATNVSGAAEMVVLYVPYERWQGVYDAPPLATAMPTCFTINPDGGVEFDTIADQAYTIRANYRKAVVAMVANTDTPMLPTKYHNAIVWWAIVHYYCPSRDQTMELMKKADLELGREMNKLYIEQLPQFGV